MLNWKRVAKGRTRQRSLPVDTTKVQRCRCIRRGPRRVLGRWERCGSSRVGYGSSRSRRCSRFSGIVGKAKANVDRLKGGHYGNVLTSSECETKGGLAEFRLRAALCVVEGDSKSMCAHVSSWGCCRPERLTGLETRSRDGRVECSLEVDLLRRCASEPCIQCRGRMCSKYPEFDMI